MIDRQQIRERFEKDELRLRLFLLTLPAIRLGLSAGIFPAGIGKKEKTDRNDQDHQEQPKVFFMIHKKNVSLRWTKLDNNLLQVGKNLPLWAI